MTFSPLDSALYGPVFAAADLAELFSDAAQVRRMVQVEVALARVQGRLGVIPGQAAAEIEALDGGTFTPDWDRLRAGLMQDGVPVVALLEQLRPLLGEKGQTYLHWGATTQDIVDTALVLGLREALRLLEADLLQLIQALSGLSSQHQETLMAGRTHSQQALPITFGLKAAGWLAPLLRHLQRLEELRPRVLVLQFGGAVGTLAALGGDGLRVSEALAGELDLAEALLPWHTQRDSLGELASWLSLLTGSLGKMAQDILLLAQSEVNEVQESGERRRGGSSTMPQKMNPIQSEMVVAAARLNATLLGAMHQALIQEHERATHGWQLEWLTLPQMLGAASGALRRSLTLARELKVGAPQMARNIHDSHGLMLAEAYSLLLSARLGRQEAKNLVRQAVTLALSDGLTLGEALRRQPEVPADLPELHEADILGSTPALLARLRQTVERLRHPEPDHLQTGVRDSG